MEHINTNIDERPENKRDPVEERESQYHLYDTASHAASMAIVQEQIESIPDTVYTMSASEVLDRTTESLFDMEKSNLRDYVGDTVQAFDAVRETIVETMSADAVSGEANGYLDALKRGGVANFLKSDRGLLSDVAQNRTAYIKNLFQLDELREVFSSSDTPSALGEYEINASEYKWATVFVAGYNDGGFIYQFYKEKPSGGSDMCDASYEVILQSTPAPHTEESYYEESASDYVGMRIKTQLATNEYQSTTAVNVPQELETVFGQLAKKVIDDNKQTSPAR